MDNTVEIDSIQDLKITSQVKDVKDPGDTESSKVLITKVTFEYEGGPGKFNSLLYSAAAGHRIDIALSSPQLILEGVN